jgi:hypothetical protein
VPGLGLGRGREDGLRQPIGLAQTLGQLDAADVAGLLVLGPAGSREIAPGHALEGHDLALLHQHRAARQRGGVGPEVLGKPGNVGLQKVILDVRELPEPEVGQLGQDLPLVGNAGGEHDVERRYAVARDEKK